MTKGYIPRHWFFFAMKIIKVKINWFVQAEFAVYQKLSDLWKVFLTVLMNKQGELGSALLFFSFFSVRIPSPWLHFFTSIFFVMVTPVFNIIWHTAIMMSTYWNNILPDPSVCLVLPYYDSFYCSLKRTQVVILHCRSMQFEEENSLWNHSSWVWNVSYKSTLLDLV